MKKSITIFLIALIFLCILLFFHHPLSERYLDFLFQITPKQTPADKIILVTLSDKDIEALGGWPITRDYYAYFIHAANVSGAKVIGMDLLPDQSNTQYAEHDNALALMLESTGNVCLPLIFQEIIRDKHIYQGKNCLSPIPEFHNRLLGTGFTNLGDSEIIRKLPIVIKDNHAFKLSFGIELARQFLDYTGEIDFDSNYLILKNRKNETLSIPINNGNYQVNYRTNFKDFEQISFVNLLRTFESKPDSLDFKNKLILLAPTAQTLPVLKNTPIQKQIPGTYIHALVAKNIISGNILQPIPDRVAWITGFSFILLFLLKSRHKLFFILSSIILINYWILSLILFLDNKILPIIPIIIIFGAVWCIQGILYYFRNQEVLQNGQYLLMNEITEIKTKLFETEANLDESIKSHSKADEKYRALILEKQRLEKHLNDLHAMNKPMISKQRFKYPDIIHATNSPLSKILQQIPAIASDDIPVLIHGETGTGKELIAKAIHTSGQRKNKPFLAINCGALSENLLESELFGHEKGSFTGAHTRRTGRFEQANHGALFLDEIAETSQTFQAKLLRVLQDGSFERVGGETTIKVDVRIIAATNKDLEQLSKEGIFRLDLFYRLNGFPINLPSLHERKTDISLLAHHFLNLHGFGSIQISNEAMVMLEKYQWPGNVRELENMMRRVALIVKSEKRNMIQIHDLPVILKDEKSPEQDQEPSYQPFEEQVLETLRLFNFSHSAINETAKILGNRDRGTITEYFRGICFDVFKNNQYDMNEAGKIISDSDDPDVQQRVINKIKLYLDSLPEMNEKLSFEEAVDTFSCFKGLPQKFHPALYELLLHFSN